MTFAGIDQKNALSAKDRVNDALNARLAEVEEKREKALLLEKKIGKMADGPERRKLVYRKKQQEEYERKRKKTPVDEERLLHESYQLVLKVKLSKRLLISVTSCILCLFQGV